MNKTNSNNSNEASYSDDEEQEQQLEQPKQTKQALPSLNMNEIATANANKTLANYYEQIFLQRNLEMYQKQMSLQQQELQLQIQPNFPHSSTNNTNSSSNKTNESCSSSTSTSSLLSISSSSSKSQQVSPSSSPALPKTYDLDQSAKYRAYMMNMAAAAAFPYSMFGFAPGGASQASAIQQQQQHQTQMAAAVAAAAAAAASSQNPYLNHANQNRNLLFENFPGLFAAAAASQQTNSANHMINNMNNSNTQYNILSNHNSHNNTNSNPHSDYSNASISSNNSTNSNNNRVSMKQEEPKPAHSYIGLIALAILSTPEKKLVLSDIYQWILDNYSYFHTRGSGWRNSIRHNLSLNDCFMKSGRSANGKGHYWTIHPANLEDFSRGDFRRRRAQRRVRKSLGLTLPEEDEEDEDDDILTPPSSLSPVPNKINVTNSSFLNIPHNNANLAMKRPLVPDNEHEK